MRLLSLLLVVVACSQTGGSSGSSGATCGVDGHSTLSGRGIGDLQVGRTIDDLRRACRVIRDTTIRGGEGLPERIVSVVIDGDTLLATIDSGRVWRIAVDRPNLLSADSLGVGVTLARLLQAGLASGAEGEGVLYVRLAEHCGLSFRLAHDLAAAEHRQNWTAEDLRKIPSQSVVDQVLIVGCNRVPS